VTVIETGKRITSKDSSLGLIPSGVDFSDLVKIPGSCCNNPKVGRGETSVPGSPHSCLASATSSFGPSSARNVFSAGLQDSTQGRSPYRDHVNEIGDTGVNHAVSAIGTPTLARRHLT
jgi:hypothetical protein